MYKLFLDLVRFSFCDWSGIALHLRPCSHTLFGIMLKLKELHRPSQQKREFSPNSLRLYSISMRKFIQFAFAYIKVSSQWPCALESNQIQMSIHFSQNIHQNISKRNAKNLHNENDSNRPMGLPRYRNPICSFHSGCDFVDECMNFNWNPRPDEVLSESQRNR